MNFETKAIHGIRTSGDKVWNNSINMASIFQLKEYGVGQEFEYGRVSNPTRKEFETLIARLENGKYGFGFSSGMAAISSIFSRRRPFYFRIRYIWRNFPYYERCF